MTHLVNLISNLLLGRSRYSCVLRAHLFRILGHRHGWLTQIHGGGFLFGGQLQSGRRCFVNRSCYFDLTASIHLGDEVVIGHGVTIITARHAVGSADRRAGAVQGISVVIEDGAWIGANSTIQPGVTIRAGSIVLPGAVVTATVPEHSVVGGVPARLVRRLHVDL